MLQKILWNSDNCWTQKSGKWVEIKIGKAKLIQVSMYLISAIMKMADFWRIAFLLIQLSSNLKLFKERLLKNTLRPKLFKSKDFIEVVPVNDGKTIRKL